MITHELVIGYPHALKRSLLFSAPRSVAVTARGPARWLTVCLPLASGAPPASPFPLHWHRLPSSLAPQSRRRHAPPARSRESHQVGQLLAPRVLHPVGKQHDPLRAERVDGALVVRD